MRGVRGIKPDRQGTDSWVASISDPFQKRERRFHFKTQDEATAKKLDVRAKIKAIQDGHFTVPENVTDIVLWLVKNGKEGVASGSKKPALIRQIIDAYLQRQKERAEVGGRGGISSGRYHNEKLYLDAFRDFCESEKQNAKSIEAALSASNLERYKLHASQQYISEYSLRDAVYSVKAMIKWAWQDHMIVDLPRNLETFRRVSLPDPMVKVFTKEEISELFLYSSARTKLYVLLALNAGYTQQDIADLQHANVNWEEGIIDEIREKVKKKAKVQRCVKLWPSTLEQLKLQATDPSDSELVLLSDSGKPLVQRTTRDEKQKVVDCVRQALDRVTRKRHIKGRSFKLFRKTGASLIKNHYTVTEIKTKTNQELFDMYLAHKPPNMNRPYDAGEWAELYEATDWLGKYLGLWDGGNLDGSG
jgi:integrase